MMENNAKHELEELVNALLENDLAAEIDVGMDGDGPVANALVALGKTREEANDIIFVFGEEDPTDEGE